MVEVQIPDRSVSADVMRQNLQGLTGVQIQQIKSLDSGAYELSLGSTADARAVLGLNGKFLVGGTQPITAQAKDHILSVLGIFDLVREKLETKQRVDEWNGHRNGNTRQTRAISEQKAGTPQRSKSPSTPRQGGGPSSSNSRSGGGANEKKESERGDRLLEPQQPSNGGNTQPPGKMTDVPADFSPNGWQPANNFVRGDSFGGRGKGGWYPQPYGYGGNGYGNPPYWSNHTSKGQGKNNGKGYGKSNSFSDGKGKGKGKGTNKGGVSSKGSKGENTGGKGASMAQGGCPGAQ